MTFKTRLGECEIIPVFQNLFKNNHSGIFDLPRKELPTVESFKKLESKVKKALKKPKTSESEGS